LAPPRRPSNRASESAATAGVGDLLAEGDGCVPSRRNPSGPAEGGPMRAGKAEALGTSAGPVAAANATPPPTSSAAAEAGIHHLRWWVRRDVAWEPRTPWWAGAVAPAATLRTADRRRRGAPCASRFSMAGLASKSDRNARGPAAASAYTARTSAARATHPGQSEKWAETSLRLPSAEASSLPARSSSSAEQEPDGSFNSTCASTASCRWSSARESRTATLARETPMIHAI
jgi:hypothetical protein